jgi:phenylacetate-CoA ligase
MGNLYGCFLFITTSIEKAPLQILQLPIVGSTPPEEIFRTVQNFEVNVIAGVPTSILGFADLVEQKRKKSPLLNVRIDRILFGGESFHPDQRARLNAIFPGVEILSVGYASTDAGLLGYADRSCLPNEHRFFDSETILELIDEETNQVITEAHRPGRIVITNLTRRLMPMIRYPVGDRAMWVENVDSKDRKFILLGRAEEGARVGPVTLQPEEILAAINDLRIDVADFQLILTHREMKDGLIIRIATRNSQPASTPAWTANLSVQLVREIHARKPLYLDLVRKHKILPIELEWVEQSQLEVNLRTGKLRKIIDQRFAPSAQAGAPLVAHS